MKTALYTCSILALLMSSCASNHLEDPISESSKQSLLPSDTKEYVMAQAKFYYEKVFPSTRADDVIVSNVIPLRRATRADGETGDQYYVVNFEDEKGFAIVGDENTTETLLAISNECNLDVNDPGLPAVVQTLVGGITLPIQPIDTITPRPEYVENISIAPMINQYVRQWGQTSPFNKYAPIIDGTQRGVGCVPVASAMIMSKYEWPTSIMGQALTTSFDQVDSGYTFEYQIDWTGMKNGTNIDNTASLLRVLGQRNWFHVYYEDQGTPTSAYQPLTWEKLGYRSNLSYVPLSSLSLSPTPQCFLKWYMYLPMIASGSTTINNETRHHSWVIDGLLHIPANEMDLYGDKVSYNRYFLHCVWGQFGVANGYYNASALTSLGGNMFDDAAGDSTYPGHSNQSSTYTWSDIEVIHSFSPNK